VVKAFENRRWLIAVEGRVGRVLENGHGFGAVLRAIGAVKAVMNEVKWRCERSCGGCD